MDELKKKVQYSYDGRNEMVNRANETIGMRVKLNTYGIGCCQEIGTTPNEPEPIGSMSLEIEVGNDAKAIKFFKTHGEFEIIIKGIAPKKD